VKRVYKRMLAGMAAKEKRRRKKDPDDCWSLYLLRCADGSLYTGITKDISRRLQMHQDGKASRYTRVRRPVALLYVEFCGTRTRALVRECQVKAYPKSKKEALAISAGPVRRKKRLNSR